MAFYIIFKNSQHCTWHVQSPKPKFNTTKPEEKIIDLLQADGDELEKIIQHFPNLPHTRSICTWRGDMAQFIYDNL
jgi:hypothetical protein